MASEGIPGRPHRVVYTAKNFTSGLVQIALKVIRPDLTISESYSLAEFEDPFLSGVYYFDYYTAPNDPLGDYIFIISNPEQSHKEGFRIAYRSSEDIDGSALSLKKRYFGRGWWR
jgi:hypothetical protein